MNNFVGIVKYMNDSLIKYLIASNGGLFTTTKTIQRKRAIANSCRVFQPTIQTEYFRTAFHFTDHNESFKNKLLNFQLKVARKNLHYSVIFRNKTKQIQINNTNPVL
jgi:hypothetical protein